jgi:WhiB family transcriptional regulator, redox-sensing transcriptional regulator
MAETTLTPSPCAGGTKAVPASPRWQRRASCRETPTALFFPAGSSRRLMLADEERAKIICSTCPVRARCLAFAIEHQEPDGVWGGLNADERRALETHGKKET